MAGSVEIKLGASLAAGAAVAVTVTVTWYTGQKLVAHKLSMLTSGQGAPDVVSTAVGAGAGVAAAGDEEAAGTGDPPSVPEPAVPKGNVFGCEPFRTDALVAGSKKTLGSFAGS